MISSSIASFMDTEKRFHNQYSFLPNFYEYHKKLSEIEAEIEIHGSVFCSYFAKFSNSPLILEVSKNKRLKYFKKDKNNSENKSLIVSKKEYGNIFYSNPI